MKFSKGWIAVFLVVGLAAVLAFPASAWNCGKYNFRVTGSGSVQVENESDSDEPSQDADVFVNGSKVINNANVPAMKAGADWQEFATISVPGGDWSWRVKGETDCSDDGEHEGDRPTATPDPTSRPSATPDPTTTPKRPTETLTPSPTETVLPSATPTTTETDIPDPSPTDKPQPSKTSRPQPSDTPKPRPTDTPKPTLTAVPSATSSPAPSATASPTLTETAYPCECFDDLEVWAHLHIDDEAKGQLADAIDLGNEDLVAAFGQLYNGEGQQLIAAELRAINDKLTWLLAGMLVSATSLGLVYYGMNRPR